MSQLDEDRKLLERIDTYGKGLTNWETKFLERCYEWLDDGPLTKPMRAVLERIDESKVR